MAKCCVQLSLTPELQGLPFKHTHPENKLPYYSTELPWYKTLADGYLKHFLAEKHWQLCNSKSARINFLVAKMLADWS